MEEVWIHRALNVVLMTSHSSLSWRREGAEKRKRGIVMNKSKMQADIFRLVLPFQKTQFIAIEPFYPHKDHSSQ